MVDSALFISGSLFTTDYLVEGIRTTPAYLAVNVAELRATLAGIAQRFPKSAHTNESQTEDDFIWPVLAAIGWTESLRQQNLSARGRDDVPDGLLFADTASKALANFQDDQSRRYEHGLAVVESKRWGRPLDRASGRDETTAPSTQMLRYLRRIDDLTTGKLRWGILSNGSKWRLYWAGARSVSEEFLEVDLSQVLRLKTDGDLLVGEGDLDHWLRVFAVMFGRDAFIKEGADDRSFHQRARAASAYYEERVASSLSNLVFEQVFPDLAKAIAAAAPQASLQDVRESALVLLYRLLFLLYAEDRNLLPVGDERYDDYSLREQRREVGRRISRGDTFSQSAARIWGHLADLSRVIDKGDASIGIPPYNGGLFASGGATLLDTIRIPDSVMASALDALSYERSSGERRYINYRDLSVQQLGSIYERLLEFEIYDDGAGALEVRPNLFARKNSGSYYTPDELVGLILDETLEPLISERLDAFAEALAKLDSSDAEAYRGSMLRDVDPATAILSLRVCDPAMGSGHFLVSLVDTLADHVLDAMAEAAVLGAEIGYASPLASKIEDIRATIMKNARAADWSIDEAQLDDRHIVRRMVLKRCVYGVDKNPMAVELAKVALWLHTFTVGAPLSFIDHHLHAGDSLFGLWVRDAIDKASDKGGELLWSDALRNAQRSAAAMKTIEALTDVEIGEAHQSASMYEDIELLTGEMDGFVSFIHALDWLNLDRPSRGLVRLWLDGQFGDPIPIARGRRAPEGGRARPEEVQAFTQIWERARALIDEERFFNWQIAFPGVWNNWASKNREGGFDAVVGNPPWDRIKLQQVEWFAARRPDIALSKRAADRARKIAQLKANNDPLFEEYTRADGRAADTARMARAGGSYPLLSRGDLNLYSLFVERAHALVKPTGMIGLLVPSGISSDLSASAFFRGIATEGHLKSLYDFENRRNRYAREPFFPDVDSRFKFSVLVTSPQRSFSEAHCGFFLQGSADVADPNRAFAIASSDFARVNPNTGTAPILRSTRDAEIITGIYRRIPILADHGTPEGKRPWDVRYCTMFHMTNDSHLFQTEEELKLAGWYPIEGMRWRKGDEEGVPLYVGRMFHQFDHRSAGVDTNEENLHNPASSDRSTAAQKADPAFMPAPQFWVPWDAVRPKRAWTLAFRDIARPTDARTIIAAMMPSGGFGNKAPLLLTDDAKGGALLLANLNAFVLDYVARSKIQSANANWYIVEQLPILPPRAYDCMFGRMSAREIVLREAVGLSYTSHHLASFAREVGYVDEAGKVLPPVIWDEDDRAQRRARLDALFFHLYGISAEDADYVLSTFPIVRRQDEAIHGRYLTRELILAHMSALAAGDLDVSIHPTGRGSSKVSVLPQ